MKATKRKRKNEIRSLHLPDGSWTTNQTKIADTILVHFQSLFCTDDSIPADQTLIADCNGITEEENMEIGREPKEEEIKHIVMWFGPLKASGPDGYPAIKILGCSRQGHL
ncbi:uncharacterized protein M6B38_246770 [Iris pallida]|uniref:Uncharacterized protein n=1 Tax=Iris pallida TaxID=29817 RepID=A0AAX6DGN6_IRIPA|nr:uncharacterized protein M6B38_246770 [Iris pallida]